ncbi:MAG: SGNH/GDSL hydrolase family protein [Clostridia bacterium]|nr:SGNH/GDSL hydrolase family protein [Clostridia bacterium]
MNEAVFETLYNCGELKAAFIGGSITEGAGAQDKRNRWSTRITGWLNSLPLGNTHITEINAGIGGTESTYGILRLRRDVLQHKPDIVFLEFGVNDVAIPEELSARCYEGILYALSQTDPVPYVICLGMVNNHNKPNRSPLHRKLAEKYGLQYIDVKQGMDERLGPADPGVNTERDSMFAKDNIHPSDKGYGFYADYVRSQMTGDSFRKPYCPEPSPDCARLTGRFINATDMEATGAWEKTGEGDWNARNYGRKGSSMVSRDPEGALVCEFSGTVMMPVLRIGRTYGRMALTLDGVTTEYDLYYETDHQPVTPAWRFDLPDGLHRLEFRPLGAKNEKSTDDLIRIDAVIVAE